LIVAEDGEDGEDGIIELEILPRRFNPRNHKLLQSETTQTNNDAERCGVIASKKGGVDKHLNTFNTV
jgi:hypothetical protein